MCLFVCVEFIEFVDLIIYLGVHIQPLKFRLESSMTLVGDTINSSLIFVGRGM